MSAAATVRSLSRWELRRFIRHPLVIAGVVGGALVVNPAVIEAEGLRTALIFLVPMPVMILWFAVVHLAVSRDERAGAEELTSSMPVGPATTTWAHLVWPVPAALTLALAWMAFAMALLGADRTMVTGTWNYEVTWTASIPELMQPLLAFPMVMLLAVAVGLWWRHPVAAFVVPAALIFFPMGFIFTPPMVDGGLVELPGRPDLAEVPARAVAWHLVYLAGAIAVIVAAALARHDRRRPLGLIAIAGLAVVAIGYVLGPLPRI